MGYKEETLLPEKKRNRPGLKGTQNSHRKGPAALRTPGTFYKQTHKFKERVGTQRTSKSSGSEITEGHKLPDPFHKHISNLEDNSPVWGVDLCLSSILLCHINFTECLQSPLCTASFPSLTCVINSLQSWLSVTLWTVARQAPLSMGFSRQEYGSGLPCPPPEDLSDPGIEPTPLMFPALWGGFLPFLFLKMKT